MMEHKVPVQSLIDHIKTAVDVDEWAKTMAEELLSKQIPLDKEIEGGGIGGNMNMINRNGIKDYLERIEESIDNALNELDPDDFDVLMEDIKEYINQFDN